MKNNFVPKTEGEVYNMKRFKTICQAKLEATGNSQNAVSEMGLGIKKSKKDIYKPHFSLGLLHCLGVCHKFNLIYLCSI